MIGIKLLIMIVLSLNLLARGQVARKDQPSENISEWKTHNENAFSIQYPGDWELNRSGQAGTTFIILSRLSSPTDKFRENVNLVVQDLSGQGIDLDKYVEISEGQIKTMITNGNLLESKRLGAEIGFHRLVFTGDQGVYKLKFEQYYFVKNERAYILTLTCEIDQFDDYKEVGEKTLSKFLLK